MLPFLLLKSIKEVAFFYFFFLIFIFFFFQMYAFIGLAKEKGMADLASTVCATGGGAHKFEPDFKREVNMNLNKFDELDSLIRGVEFMVENSKFHELFYYDHPQVGNIAVLYILTVLPKEND